MSRQLTLHSGTLDKAESTICCQILSGMLEANTFNPLDVLLLTMENNDINTMDEEGDPWHGVDTHRPLSWNRM